VDLKGVDLRGADLTGADLTEAQVSKAKLAGVDLTSPKYAPVSEPPDPYVADIKGLATLNATSGEEIGLIQLRKLLQDAGLSDSAREATFSIQRNIITDQIWNDSRPAQIEGYLRTVGFEWTTAYGLHPERALRWILLQGAVLTPVYMFAMLRPTAASGVMRVLPAERLEGTAGDPADEEKRKKHLVHAKGWLAALPTAAYFSLISAVNIGFEDFTPGDWIRRLQTREYSLEAVGWVRVVAGAQALLSVYLLAMWVLTRFGQPFE
jgi:Pentapeptide repeats (8 copies)